MRKLLLIVILGFTGLISHSQVNNNWYFGRQAGLDFNQPGPGLLMGSNMAANEAAGSASDINGQLLFYTNGVTVYNRDHQVMVNGDDIGGHVSACQLVIVPVPGNDSIYYIFTTDAIENFHNGGYRYSIVNMKHAGGKGAVVSKNTLLWSSCTERIGAARHFNGQDIWIITNDINSNIFRSWLITCDGLQPNAVVSTTGVVLNQNSFTNVGMIKLNSAGTKLLQTHFPQFDELMNPPNFVQLFDFDNATGVISNPQSIGFPGAQYTHGEFSPSGNFVYLTRPYDKKIDQLEVLPSLPAILASRMVINTTASFFDIQRAPDNRIYITKPGVSLASIDFPNLKAPACGFVENKVNVAPGGAYIGLPSFINDASSSSSTNGFTYTILDSCTGRVQFSGNSTMPGTLGWSWDFGDGNTSTIQNPVHSFTPFNAVYNVKLQISSSILCGVITRSQLVRPGGFVSDVDFDFVKRCDSGYVRFINKSADPGGAGGQYEWHFGDGNSSTAVNPVHTYAVPAVYAVKLKFITPTSCLDDSLTTNVDMRTFVVDASPDRTILIGETVQLTAASPVTNFEWTPATGLNDPMIRNPIALPLNDIVYTVKATDPNGCSAYDSVRITVQQLDDFYVPTGFTPNNDGKNEQIKPFFGGRFTLKDFSIFTRWGQQVFQTNQRGKGWDGRINGVEQGAGVYIWKVSAVENTGKVITRKGTFVLIR